MRVVIILILVLVLEVGPSFENNDPLREHALHGQQAFDFTVSWEEADEVLYKKPSVKDLEKTCKKVVNKKGDPCDKEYIKSLRYAQKLAKEWREIVRLDWKISLRCIPILIIITLVIVLMVLGHYRIKDLWYVPPERQWENETDPTWGLPGKVYSLLAIRVVKTKEKDAQPTDRKYSAYTENPIMFRDKFWYFKQTMRDMYKQSQNAKRNRYFHKLSWQFLKLKKIVPETLRKQKKMRRKIAEVEEIKSNPSSEEFDPEKTLPMEVALADEVNMATLTEVKERLKYEIQRATEAGLFKDGRYVTQQHHHKTHHDLTKDDVAEAARALDVDPNPDCVTVDGQMRRHPEVPKSLAVGRPHHHHHRHNNADPSPNVRASMSHGGQPAKK